MCVVAAPRLGRGGSRAKPGGGIGGEAPYSFHKYFHFVKLLINMKAGKSIMYVQSIYIEKAGFLARNVCKKKKYIYIKNPPKISDQYHCIN